METERVHACATTGHMWDPGWGIGLLDMEQTHCLCCNLTLEQWLDAVLEAILELRM